MKANVACTAPRNKTLQFQLNRRPFRNPKQPHSSSLKITTFLNLGCIVFMYIFVLTIYNLKQSKCCYIGIDFSSHCFLCLYASTTHFFSVEIMFLSFIHVGTLAFLFSFSLLNNITLYYCTSMHWSIILFLDIGIVFIFGNTKKCFSKHLYISDWANVQEYLKDIYPIIVFADS